MQEVVQRKVFIRSQGVPADTARLGDIAGPETLKWAIPELWEHLIYLLGLSYGEVVKNPRYPDIICAIEEAPPRYARKIVKKAFFINKRASARLARHVADEEIFPSSDVLIPAIERFIGYLDEFDRIVDAGGLDPAPHRLARQRGDSPYSCPEVRSVGAGLTL